MARIRGDNASNEIHGTRLADYILGLAGNDDIDGSAGNDLINAGAGDDEVDGGDVEPARRDVRREQDRRVAAVVERGQRGGAHGLRERAVQPQEADRRVRGRGDVRRVGDRVGGGGQGC